MLIRDELGIICQHDIYEPDKRPDGGDSASRTGIMALFGSKQDADLLHHFVDEYGWCRRHPTQVPWNNPHNFTRDNLIPLVAGLYAWEMKEEAMAVFRSHRNRDYRCQNTEKDYPGTKKPWWNGADLLMPDHRAHLIKGFGIGEDGWPKWGKEFLNMSIWWSTKVKPWSEQNQIVCQVMVAGPEYVQKYKAMHPDYKKALRDYWCGWRDQAEIYKAMIYVLEKI